MLCDSAVKQFASIYRSEFGVVLPEDEARLKAQRVFSFFKVIITEISKDEKVQIHTWEGGDRIDNKNKSNQI